MYLFTIIAAIFVAEISASSLVAAPDACPEDVTLNCPLGYTPRLMLVTEDGSPELKCACVRDNTVKDPKQELSHTVLAPMGKRVDDEMIGGCKVCECVLDSSKDPSICSKGCMRRRNGHPYCHCSIRRSFSPSKCPTLCPYGYEQDERGCSTCHCKPSNDVVLSARCSNIVCALHCPGGYEVDENNCPTCKCKSISSDLVSNNCPAIHCDSKCERGYEVDENNCLTCECKSNSNDIALNKCQKTECNLFCLGGLEVDKNGCEICQCNWQCPQIACTMDCIHGYVKDSNNCDTCYCLSDTPSLDGGDAAGTTKG